MTPDDPRHGTNAGYVAGCRQDCCRTAHATYRRSVWRKRYARRTDRLYIDATGTIRRIRALQALGWRFVDIDRAMGKDIAKAHQGHAHNITRQTKVHVDTAAAVAAVYSRLSMTVPDLPLANRQRKIAAKHGWAPPLAWDDIDNDPEPAAPTITADVDEAVVLRLLAGERVPATVAEKDEAMRRWVAAGRTRASLNRTHGWRDARYGKAS